MERLRHIRLADIPRWCLTAAGDAIASLLILCVRGYQIALRPLLIGSCKFVPTCSEYFIEALRVHGWVRGSLYGFWRLCRCHPFSPGGIDLVPPPRGGQSNPPQS